ncbi:MAG: hypothetical protein J6Y42_00905 [Bacilli bacterium]|nr:hypothetical protein [Bacilli bacterium]
MNYSYLDMKLERLVSKLDKEELTNLIDKFTNEYYINCFNKEPDKVEQLNRFFNEVSSKPEYNDYINYSLLIAANKVFERIIGSKIELYNPKYIESEDTVSDLFNEEDILRFLDESGRDIIPKKELTKELKQKEQYIKDLEEELYQLKTIEGVILDEEY